MSDGLTPKEKVYAAAARRGSAEFAEKFVADGHTYAEAGKWYTFYSFIDPDGDYKPEKDSKSSGSKGSGNYAGSPTKPGGWLLKGLSTQYKDNKGMSEHEFMDLNDVLGTLIDKNDGSFKTPAMMLSDLGSMLGEGIVTNLQQQNDLLVKINSETGMLGDLSATFREEITEAYPHALRLGISFDVLSSAVSNLVAESGKFKLLGRETIEEMALASIFAEDMGEYAAMAGDFERVSLGIYDMTQATNKAGKDALSIGLNSRRTVKELNENLYLLNEYGFENGVEGLSRMVQKSIEFRLNMSSVSSLAEKVWSPEGALELVSNMQVLGGAIGDLNDPLKMMYMATNDMEGLQDAIIGASKSLVTYNNEQGRFEVTGANLRRAKEMAKELGMNMKELTTTAVASMERTQAASDLMSQGLTMKKEDREFLTNLSQMKDGKMVIEVPKSLQEQFEGTEIALENMSQKQADKLLLEKKHFESLSMNEIARSQVGFIENISRDVSFVAATMRIQTGKMGNDVAAVLGYNPLEAAMEAKSLADSIAGGIDTQIMYDYMNSEYNMNLKHKTPTSHKTVDPNVVETTEKTKEKVITSETTDKVDKKELTVTMTATDKVTGALKAMMLGDSRFVSNSIFDYLYSIPVQR